MKYCKLITSAILPLLAGISIAGAQETTRNLQECIEIAMQGNLTMQSGKISVERAKRLQATAFNIEKTNLSLTQDPTSGGSPDNSMSVSQNFDFPTVYTSRHSLLKAETGLERSNLEVTRNELVRQISSVYCQLLYARENILILKHQDSIYKKYVSMVTAKVKAGETGRLEQLNADRILGENQTELQKAETDYRNVRLTMQLLLNTDELINPAETGITVIAADYLPPGDFNPFQTPVNQVFESKKTIGRKSLNLAKQEFLPSFSFTLRSQYIISKFNPYNIQKERFDGGNFMGFEAGIKLPVFFADRIAKTRAARCEVNMLNMQQQDALLSLGMEYQIALNEYEKAKNILNYYQTQSNRRADEISRIAQISYEKGEIGYLEYIQNLKSATELQLKYTDAVNNYNQSVIKINYLQGNK
jgi:cobalt-zinc-cadmium resistance protein CzcA